MIYPLSVTRVRIWKGPLHGTYATISGDLPNVLPGLPDGHTYRLRKSMSGNHGYVYTDTGKMRNGVSAGQHRKRSMAL